MTQHIEIQNPEEYTLLFTDDTDKEKLEEICMTLAHLPTAEAAALLAKFNEHIRAKEVEWLTCAIEENQYLHLTPCNEHFDEYVILDFKPARGFMKGYIDMVFLSMYLSGN
jgi:ATP-dependent exoDNAse (exonuclease V) beta subunit